MATVFVSATRHGAALLCVVQWLHRVRRKNSYSLVRLELGERALRWQDFPTVEAAVQAIDACEPDSVRQRQVPVATPMGPEKRAFARWMGPGQSACSRRVCAALRTESKGRLPGGTATVARRSDELS